LAGRPIYRVSGEPGRAVLEVFPWRSRGQKPDAGCPGLLELPEIHTSRRESSGPFLGESVTGGPGEGWVEASALQKGRNLSRDLASPAGQILEVPGQGTCCPLRPVKFLRSRKLSAWRSRLQRRCLVDSFDEKQTAFVECAVLVEKMDINERGLVRG